MVFRGLLGKLKDSFIGKRYVDINVDVVIDIDIHDLIQEWQNQKSFQRSKQLIKVGLWVLGLLSFFFFNNQGHNKVNIKHRKLKDRVFAT